MYNYILSVDGGTEYSRAPGPDMRNITNHYVIQLVYIHTVTYILFDALEFALDILASHL